MNNGYGKLSRAVFVGVMILAVILIASCGISVSAGRVYAVENFNSISGEGSETNPFIIENVDGFKELSDAVNAGNDFENKFFIIKENTTIDFSEVSDWQPIGLMSEEDASLKYFRGHFDGNKERGAVVKNFKSNSQNFLNALFGWIGAGATVKNIAFSGASELSGGDFVGVLAGVNYGTVSGISVENGVIRAGESATAAGGIAGGNYGIIRDCTVGTLTVSGAGYVGGIAGVNEKSDFDGIDWNYFDEEIKISECSVDSLTVESGEGLVSSAGGIVGDNSRTVSDIAVKTKITLNGETNSAGGVAGSNSSNIYNCYAHGEFIWNTAIYSGGIAGTNNGSIAESYFYGRLKARSAGGIAGYNGGEIVSTLTVGKTSVNGGDIICGVSASGEGNAGGIAAVNEGDFASITNSVAFSNVSGGAYGAIMATGDGNVSGCFFAEGSVYEENAEGAVNLTELSAEELGEKWSVASGRLPMIKSFTENEEYADDAAKASSLTATATVALDSATFTVYNGMAFVFSIPAKTGYEFTGWKGGGTTFEGKTLAYLSGQNSFISDWRLKDIEIISADGGINKTYDGVSSVLRAVFSHDLPLTYVWYFSVDGEKYLPLQNDTDSVAVVNAADSGSYYCEATVSDGGKTASARSGIIEVVINKASYSFDDLPSDYISEVQGGKYSNKTLSEYALSENFFWGTPAAVPKAGSYEYAAYYNANVNYENYPITVTVILEKGVWSGISHESIDGGVYNGLPLSAYELQENYSWADSDALPIAGTHEYVAVFNADRENYEDFLLKVVLTLSKASYESVTYPRELNGTYSPEIRLDDYGLLQNFRWKDGSLVPTANVNEYDAFYNDDPQNYNDYPLKITLNVKKATPKVYIIYDGSGLFENDDMPEISLSSNSTVGTVRWESKKVAAGENEYKYYFTPSDSVNYESASGTAVIYAEKLVIEEISVSGTIKTDYVAYDKLKTDNITVTVHYNNGKTKIITDYTVAYGGDNDSLRFGDTEAIIRYVEDGTALSYKIAVTVEKRIITEPKDKTSRVYNGNTQQLTLEESVYYTVGGQTEGVNAKEYTAYATLKDSENLRWKNTDGAVAEIKWMIARKPVEKPVITKTYYYTGDFQTLEIASNADYEVINSRQREADSYDVTVALRDRGNTVWADGLDGDLNLNWVINRVKLNAPRAVERSYVYSGSSLSFEYVLQTGMTVSGDRQVNAGPYTVTFGLFDGNYEWADGGVIKTLPWTIEPRPVEKPAPSAVRFTYDGTTKNIGITDTAAYVCANNNGTNAGDYTAEITLSSGNYIWNDGSKETLSFLWKIDRRAVSVPEVGSALVYTGSALAAPIPAADYYVLSGESSGTDAREYVCEVVLAGNNYMWTDGALSAKLLTWKIEPKVLNLPTVGRALVYSGASQNAPINVAAECVVTGIRSAVIVGKYDIMVELPDLNNYRWTGNSIEKQVLQWEIQPLTVMRPTANYSATYNGIMQYAAISESDYYNISGNSATDAGDYTATVSLKDKSNCRWDNNTVEDLSIRWRILRLSVEIPVNVGDVLYDGTLKTANINASSDCVLSGNTATDAGKYTATAVLKDGKNYAWSDNTTEPKSIEWNIFAISLKLNGGTGTGDFYVTAGAPLPTPSKEGYYFDGWYLTEDFSGERVTSVSEVSENLSLFAKWSEINSNTNGESITETKSGGGLSTFAIVGITIMCICAAIAVCIFILSFSRKRGRKR